MNSRATVATPDSGHLTTDVRLHFIYVENVTATLNNNTAYKTPISFYMEDNFKNHYGNRTTSFRHSAKRKAAKLASYI